MIYEYQPGQFDHIIQFREGTNANSAQTMKLASGYEEIGCAGEWAYAEYMGVPFNDKNQPGGDKGIDYRHELKVDVKTTSDAARYGLGVDEGKVRAHVYVLAERTIAPDGRRFAEPIGWQWGATVKQFPVIEWQQPGKNSRDENTVFTRRQHKLTIHDLYSMDQLKAILDVVN